LIAALLSDRPLGMRSVERKRLPELIRYADMFADLDDYRDRNRKKR
jgi:hypothetical protein